MNLQYLYLKTWVLPVKILNPDTEMQNENSVPEIRGDLYNLAQTKDRQLTDEGGCHTIRYKSTPGICTMEIGYTSSAQDKMDFTSDAADTLLVTPIVDVSPSRGIV